MIDFSKVTGLTIPIVPVGYTHLQYIESTGTQYINTGVSAPEGFRFRGKIQFTGSGGNAVIGAYDPASPYYRNFLYAEVSTSGQWLIGALEYEYFGTVQLNTDYEIDFSTVSGNIYCNLNGVKQSLSFVPSSRTRSANTLYLGALNIDNADAFAKAKIYACQLYVGGVLVRDFVPCRNASGVVGMYDKVENRFYGNNGSGEFVAGAERSCAVTQITDASGMVLWMLDAGFDGTFKVKKITSDTYAGETTYENEEFILLDIYPKTNGTVYVTYEGVTKTITDTSGAEDPNAQQVFFGTFNGVSDEVETPSTGIVTITGDWRGAGCAAFSTSKYFRERGKCITDVGDLSGIEIVPDYAFFECGEIKNVKLPASVTSIGDYAFQNCVGLKSITIPASVTSIGRNPWNKCFKDNGIIVESGNTSYKIDGNCLIEIATNTIICGFADAVIPSYITAIGNYAFYYCEDFASINIPNSVTSIGNSAFYYCRGLTSVEIPNSVTSIDSNAFSNCEGLTSITIPASVTSIGDGAFQNCVGLTSIIIPASVTSIGNNAFFLESGNSRTVTMLSATPATLGGTYTFDEAGTNKIVVPAGSGKTYKAATRWQEYADYITEAS